MRLPWRLALVMLATSLPFTVPTDAVAQQQRESRALLDTLVPLSATGTVDLSNVGGRISVTGWDRNEVRVQATGTQGDVRFHAAPARVSLSVEHEHGEHHGDVRYELSVPRGARVLMHSMTGELVGRDLSGEVEARSMTGSIRLDGVGRAVASSMSGSVRLTGVRSGVNASAVTGDLVLEDVQGEIEASSTSGSVIIRSARARVVRAGSMSGNILYQGSLERDGRYELQSHSGNVSLVLPDDADALLAVETFSGNITSDFTIVLQPGTVSTQRRFELSIGGSGRTGPRVSATSFSGSIAIRRASAGSSGGGSTESHRPVTAVTIESPDTESRR